MLQAGETLCSPSQSSLVDQHGPSQLPSPRRSPTELLLQMLPRVLHSKCTRLAKP